MNCRKSILLTIVNNAKILTKKVWKESFCRIKKPQVNLRLAKHCLRFGGNGVFRTQPVPRVPFSDARIPVRRRFCLW